MARIEFRGVSKSYGDVEAVRALDLRVEEGEFFSLLGPSGCGKTTTLRMVAGFVRPTTGTILIGDRDVTHVPIEKRNVGIVFQNYAIFPHMNVYENLAFGLQMRKKSKGEIDRVVKRALAQVGLEGYEDRYQREMSGGEQQRVALARVLVTEPRVLLLDEPLSALDRKLREEMKYWVKELQRDLGITTLYVTHDQGEALTLSDRVAVMNRGEVLQVASPADLYERPVDQFVANFIGRSNILDVEIVSVDGETAEVMLEGIPMVARLPRLGDVPSSGRGSVMVRPEHVLVGEEVTNGECRLRAVVQSRTYEGSIIRYALGVGDAIVVAEVQNRPGAPVFEEGSEVDVGWTRESCALLVR